MPGLESILRIPDAAGHGKEIVEGHEVIEGVAPIADQPQTEGVEFGPAIFLAETPGQSEMGRRMAEPGVRCGLEAKVGRDGGLPRVEHVLHG